MAGATCALEGFAYRPCALNRNASSPDAVWIHLVHIRSKDKLSVVSQGNNICFERAGIAVKVFTLTKLQRVDKDRDHNNVCEFACSGDEGKVAFMQCSHGGNQCKGFSF